MRRPDAQMHKLAARAPPRGVWCPEVLERAQCACWCLGELYKRASLRRTCSTIVEVVDTITRSASTGGGAGYCMGGATGARSAAVHSGGTAASASTGGSAAGARIVAAAASASTGSSLRQGCYSEYYLLKRDLNDNWFESTPESSFATTDPKPTIVHVPTCEPHTHVQCLTKINSHRVSVFFC
jgi:hypothetical protein